MWLVLRRSILDRLYEEKDTTSFVKMIEIADTRESTIGSNLSDFITP